MKAAVLTGVDTPLETRDDIEIAPPGPGNAVTLANTEDGFAYAVERLVLPCAAGARD